MDASEEKVEERARILIIGGGYGGTLVAKELDSAADVTLVDPREGFVNAAASLPQ